MSYSSQVREKVQRELRDSPFGRMRMSVQSLAAVAFIALLAAGPIAGQRDAAQPGVSEPAAQAQRAVPGVEEHRRMVFDQRRQAWKQQRENSGSMMASETGTP